MLLSVFRKKISLGLLMLTLVSGSVSATNGYFTHGLGVKNKALAGAGTASPEEAMAISTNPAATVLVGNRLEGGLAMFSPRRQYSASQSQAMGHGGAFTIDAGTVHSGSDYFAIPYIAKTWQLGDGAAAGVAMYGRGGMNTDYTGGSATFDPDGPGPAGVMTLSGSYGAGDAGVDMSQLFIDAAYASSQGSLAWGVSLVVAVQAFEASGFNTFAPYTRTFAESGGTQMPAHLSDNGHDYAYGVGFKGGVIWDLSEQLNVALSYQSQIAMSEFDKYRDLFAESGGFDIPSSLRAGLSYTFAGGSKLHYDVEYTRFSDIASVGNPLTNLFSCPTVNPQSSDFSGCLGGSGGAGFGWDNMTTHKLGYQWRHQQLPEWVFRAGYSRGEQPVDPSQVLFNMMAPGVVEEHFTLGFSRRSQAGGEYSVTVMYAPEKSVSGANPFDPTQSIELSMNQYEVEIAYSW